MKKYAPHKQLLGKILQLLQGRRPTKMEMNMIKSGIRALRENAQVAYIASVSEEGFPQIKGMLVLEQNPLFFHQHQFEAGITVSAESESVRVLCGRHRKSV